jgi:DNA-binding NarL/FixJ family response regulator
MNIALIDDHTLLSEMLSKALTNSMDGAVVRAFNSAEQFLANNFNEWEPQLIISDLLMPGLNGIELAEKAIQLLGPHCKFILLTSVTDVHTIKSAMRQGYNGYLGKDSSVEELVEAIQVVNDGGQYISKPLKNSLVKFMFADEEVVLYLSPREKDVLLQVCAGKTPKEIAYDSKLSIYTVQQYIKTVMRKFKVNRTTDLVLFAIKKGIYNPGDDDA